MTRAIVAEFHKDPGGRLELFSLVSIDKDGREYLWRTAYDVDRSRRYGYLFHESGAGGRGAVPVSGIYFASGDVSVKETPCQLVDARERSPWRGKRTRAIRHRNRTRRLRALPKAFDLEPGWDLLDWLEHRAINEEAVWCAECRDRLPSDELCAHCWWCEATGWYSTPSERCGCKDREACEHSAAVEGRSA